MIKIACKEFGQRPSDYMGFDGNPMERIIFDNRVLTVETELASKTMKIDKLADYVKGFTPRTWGKSRRALGGSY